jgi:hypothetical protein
VEQAFQACGEMLKTMAALAAEVLYELFLSPGKEVPQRLKPLSATTLPQA